MVKYILRLFFVFILIPACHKKKIEEKYGNTFYPPDGKILIFSHQLSYPEYLENMSQPPSGLTIHTSLYNNVNVSLEKGKKIQKLSVFLEQNQNLLPNLILHLDNSYFTPIYTGQLDSLIDSMAEAFNKYKQPIYLNLGFDVNHPLRTIHPQRYIKAYRYLVDRFRINGVENVSYVWPIIAMIPRHEPYVDPLNFHPGDKYVNWIGLSMHNITDSHFPVEEGTYFKAPDYERILRISKDKNIPIMICESSTRSVKKNYGFSGEILWNDWYKPFFEFTENPNVKAITHIFYAWEDQVILRQWRTKMNEDRFVHSFDGLDNLLGHN